MVIIFRLYHREGSSSIIIRRTKWSNGRGSFYTGQTKHKRYAELLVSRDYDSEPALPGQAPSSFAIWLYRLKECGVHHGGVPRVLSIGIAKCYHNRQTWAPRSTTPLSDFYYSDTPALFSWLCPDCALMLACFSTTNYAFSRVFVWIVSVPCVSAYHTLFHVLRDGALLVLLAITNSNVTLVLCVPSNWRPCCASLAGAVPENDSAWPSRWAFFPALTQVLPRTTRWTRTYEVIFECPEHFLRAPGDRYARH